MKLASSALQISATDLATFSSCHHATALDLGVARGTREKSAHFSAMIAALRERGIEHERRYVESLRAKGLSLVDLSAQKGRAGAAATLAAMRAGSDAIVQATLEHLPWTGVADVLLRCDVPSTLGAWSYLPVDTKLATETRATTVLQLSLYAELLRELQGVLPNALCVVVPGEAPTPFSELWLRSGDFDAYFRFVRRQLAGAAAEAAGSLEARTYPEPVAHCNVCKWWEVCDQRRRKDDHLSLVAGASRLQRRELESHAVRTLAVLADVPIPLPWKPGRGSRAALERVREQARVQLQGRVQQTPVHELLPVEEGQGLTRLPPPDPADVSFDLEGDPFAPNGGREYLFGLAYRDRAGDVVYEAHWASTPTEERAAFEKVVALFEERRETNPGFHVYHYAPYEPAALKRLMGRYASCEDEIDALLRGEKLVDLFRITRQSVRASVERYSIKDLEVFYGFTRTTDLQLASQSRRAVEKAIEAADWASVPDEVRSAVEAYNRDDCVSAMALRDWLETLRAQHEAAGVSVPRPAAAKTEAGEDLTDRVREVRALMTRLTYRVPDDVGTRSDQEQARWLLAQELEYDRREEKSEWWEHHRIRRLDHDELLDEKRAIAGLRFEQRLPRPKGRKTETDRYSFPAQECGVEAGDLLLLTGSGDELGEVVAIDGAARTVDIRKRGDQAEHHPSAVFEHRHIRTEVLADSLMRLGYWVADHGLAKRGRFDAARELLLHRPPRLSSGRFAPAPGEDTLAFACRVVGELDGSVLPIQGPPGAGKTYTAARMICALVQSGKKVGVTAHSHKVIHKLLEEVCKAAAEAQAAVRCVAKVDEPDSALPFEQVKDTGALMRVLQEQGAGVVGATAWLWARQDAEESVDVLFVDEAGQMSLAKTLAAAPAAKSLVLVGDPRQLQQPMKGAHPDGAAISALDHLLGKAVTIPEDRGLFLAETWRLAPALCEFTSHAFYEGRLHAREGRERQQLVGTQGFDGAGLFYVPAEHDGNQNASPEEVRVVERVVERLLAQGSSWTNAEGVAQPLRPEHLLTVAPYNAQVSLLAETLGERGVKVGTVDKFQGQEAPVVLYSMATSTPDEAPRGMDFLYSLNRLNVASSRARCACILIASPRLFEPECRSVEHVRLANAFCRYLELARRVEAGVA